MKKFILIMILAVFCMGVALPPLLPSSFYGYTDLRIGTTIKLFVDGKIILSTKTFNYEGQSVYFFNAPGELEGKLIEFKVGKAVLASAIIHSGTNVQIDLFRNKLRR